MACAAVAQKSGSGQPEVASGVHPVCLEHEDLDGGRWMFPPAPPRCPIGRPAGGRVSQNRGRSSPPLPWRVAHTSAAPARCGHLCVHLLYAVGLCRAKTGKGGQNATQRKRNAHVSVTVRLGWGCPDAARWSGLRRPRRVGSIGGGRRAAVGQPAGDRGPARSGVGTAGPRVASSHARRARSPHGAQGRGEECPRGAHWQPRPRGRSGLAPRHPTLSVIALCKRPAPVPRRSAAAPPPRRHRGRVVRLVGTVAVAAHAAAVARKAEAWPPAHALPPSPLSHWRARAALPVG